MKESIFFNLDRIYENPIVSVTNPSCAKRKRGAKISAPLDCVD